MQKNFIVAQLRVIHVSLSMYNFDSNTIIGESAYNYITRSSAYAVSNGESNTVRHGFADRNSDPIGYTNIDTDENLASNDDRCIEGARLSRQ